MFDAWGWRLMALGSAFFAGLTAVLIKAGLTKEGDKEINSNLATVLRTVIVLALSALLVSARREWEPLSRLSRWGVAMLVLSGVTTGLSWLCYNRALQQGPASLVAPIDKLSVALAILLAWLFLGEAVTWQAVLGGLLVVVGVVILALPTK